ncbi:MAG: pyruvate formate lyase-activating protein [Bacilli bacterium]|jgi:pyruvate formate lyase activating enzyme|nr:pyruvate formate lyase-activating protein [Bacilli bacterium]
MQASINSIESCGTVDGPGIRTVIFFNKCLLRCKYCHNPECFNMQGLNYTCDDLIEKIKRYKPYYGETGGVTLSGGEPLLQAEFVISFIKKLKKENIHIALDTAGITDKPYQEIVDNVDLIIYDIKDITEKRYRDLTGGDINKTWEFLNYATSKHKKFWIRQVIVPDLHDNLEYIKLLSDYLHNHFNEEDIEKIEFIPYHKLGSEKYTSLNLKNFYEDKKEMDVLECDKLYKSFLEIHQKT